MEFDDLSKQVLGCAIEVHRGLGPGLLESVYQQCLAYEMSLAGLHFLARHPIPVTYKQVKLDCGYELDFLVDESLIIELKTVETLLPVHQAQLLTYMKLCNARIGLLVNFNVKLLKEGIKRFVL